MSVALTNGVNYSLKPTSVKATRKQVLIPSSNKTSFSPEETCIFYLPSLRNHVMDGQSGYLRLTLTVGAGAGYLDNCGQALIQRIQTYGSGGQLISDIDQYNVLATMLTDLQLSQSEKIGLSSTLGAEDVYGTVGTVGVVADDAALGSKVLFDAGFTATSTVTDSNRRGMALAAGSYTLCIPLLHPLFSLSEKMWPAFAMADDTRVEITWSSVINSTVQVGGTGITWTLSNPEILVDYIEFDSGVFPLIQQTYAGRDLIIPSQDYRTYSSQIASGTTGSISQIIPCKVMSARAFFFAFRPAESQVAAGYASSGRTNPFYSAQDNFRLNIGGVAYPQKPITTRVAGNFAEYFASTQTALHAFNNLSMNGALNRSYYNVSGSDTGHQNAANSYRNAFALAINVDTLRGQSETSNSGLSLANLTTYYEGYIGTSNKATGGGDEAVSVSTFVLHDVMFIVDASGNVQLRF